MLLIFCDIYLEFTVPDIFYFLFDNQPIQEPRRVPLYRGISIILLNFPEGIIFREIGSMEIA